MGIKGWIESHADAAPVTWYGDVFLYQEEVARQVGMGKEREPLGGVTASVEAGEALRKRVTGTRLVALGVFALGAKKKSGGESYLTVEGPDFFWTVEVKRGDQGKARKFAAEVNAAARQPA